MKLAQACIVACLTLLVSVTAYAGGPMLVGSPAFGADGQPFVWDNSRSIQYRTDGGNLGSMDNTTANSHVQQAFAAWTQVPTASLSAQRIGTIQGVSGGDVRTVADFNAVYGTCDAGTQTPIVYDNDGSLFGQLIGDSSVIGLTAICNLSADGHIRSAVLLLTGGAGLTTAEQDHVMIHELGHLLGLDHSLPGTNPCGTSVDDIAAIPMMFYQLTNQTKLAADDKAWISKLYPSASYGTSYGTISGRVLFSDGQNAVQDVLVSAHPASPNSMAGEDRKVSISSISGYRFTGNPGQPYTANYLACEPASKCPNGYYGNNVDGDPFGSRKVGLLGLFEIPVPVGSYAVEVSDMQGAKDIGPISPALPAPGSGEYWSTNESATDADFSQINCTEQQHLDYVGVQAGATKNIDIIMNRTAPPFDIFEQGESGLTPNTGLQTNSEERSVAGGRR